MDDKIKTILKANHLYDKDNKKLENFNITHNKLDEFYNTYKQKQTIQQSRIQNQQKNLKLLVTTKQKSKLNVS